MGLSQAQKDQLSKIWIRSNFSGGALVAGLIPGANARLRRGRNLDIDQGSLPETIWPPGGIYPFQTTPFQASVVSTDANDTLAGTGAQTLQILGLDQNLVRVEEIVNLNGLTPVLTVRTDWLRIAEIIVATAGADPTGTNIGDINVSVDAGPLQAVAPATFGVSVQAVHTVEAGHTGFVVGRGAQMLKAGSGTEVEITLFLRPPGGAWLILQQFALRGSGTSSFFDSRVDFPIDLPGGTDVDARLTFADSNNLAVIATMDILEVRNDLLQPIYAP